MIALTNKESMPDGVVKEKHFLEEMFRKEIDAYCAYKDFLEETDDDVLEMALEEIMIDEYLHANFLRDYMMDHDMYIKDPEDPHERKFKKIHNKIFKEY